MSSDQKEEHRIMGKTGEVLTEKRVTKSKKTVNPRLYIPTVKDQIERLVELGIPGLLPLNGSALDKEKEFIAHCQRIEKKKEILIVPNIPINRLNEVPGVKISIGGLSHQLGRDKGPVVYGIGEVDAGLEIMGQSVNRSIIRNGQIVKLVTLTELVVILIYNLELLSKLATFFGAGGTKNGGFNMVPIAKIQQETDRQIVVNCCINIKGPIPEVAWPNYANYVNQGNR